MKSSFVFYAVKDHQTNQKIIKELQPIKLKPDTDPYTCQALGDRQPAMKKNGYHEFASPEKKPFRVYCDFSKTPVVTEVHHNKMAKETIHGNCEDAGCFVSAPQYEVDQVNMGRIINNSVRCQQHLRLGCQGVRINSGDKFGYWISRNGHKMLNWGGTERNNSCACGDTNTCLDNAHECNCDQNSDNIETADEGYLTDKTKLPIREVRLGDLSGSSEIAWLTIGKLECFGQV